MERLSRRNGWDSWAGALVRRWEARAESLAIPTALQWRLASERTSGHRVSVARFEAVWSEAEQMGFDAVDPPPGFVKFCGRAEGQSTRFVGLQVAESVQASHSSLDLAPWYLEHAGGLIGIKIDCDTVGGLPIRAGLIISRANALDMRVVGLSRFFAVEGAESRSRRLVNLV